MNDRGLAMLPWFPGDFMRSTRGWSVTAKGVYRELLDAQWDLGKLPHDPEKLRVLIGATPEEWARGWPLCESKFPGRLGRCRLNPTLELHRGKSRNLRESRIKGAEATNAKRAAQRDAQRNSSDTPSDTPSERFLSDPLLSDPIRNNPYPTSPPLTGSGAPAPKAKASRLPNDFTLTVERAAYASAQGIASPGATFADFVDYWKSASGAKARKCDWDATWRMWCRRQNSFANSNTTGVRSAPPRRKTADELEAEETARNAQH